MDEDHSQVSVVQIHPDAASMEYHLEVVGDRARQAYAQTLEATTGIQVFGTPTGPSCGCSGSRRDRESR
jgi:hypothetical protein